MKPALLIAAINAAIEVIGFLLKQAQVNQQDTEWTAEEDKAYADTLDKLPNKDAWKILD